MQWIVIGVLLVSSIIGGIMLTSKVNQLADDNETLVGNEASLRSQVKQFRAQIPSPTPTPVFTPTPSTAPATPMPTPKR